MKSQVSGATTLPKAPLQHTPLTTGCLGGKLALRQPALLRGPFAAAQERHSSLGPRNVAAATRPEAGELRSGMMEEEGGTDVGALLLPLWIPLR